MVKKIFSLMVTFAILVGYIFPVSVITAETKTAPESLENQQVVKDQSETPSETKDAGVDEDEPVQETVIIQDKNLELAILDELNLPEGTSISEAHMLSLEQLDASSREISVLNGLEHAINLQALNLSKNDINDLSPLASLVNLKTLNVKNNRISQLAPLEGLVNLQNVNFSGNPIKDISILERMRNLQTVQMGNTQLNLTEGSDSTRIIQNLLSNGVRVLAFQLDKSEAKYNTILFSWIYVGPADFDNHFDIKVNGETSAIVSKDHRKHEIKNLHPGNTYQIEIQAMDFNAEPITLALSAQTQNKHPYSRTGWVQSDNSWYYFDKNTGVMKTGWLYERGKWYYLRSTGIMATGWEQVDGKWYYLDYSGAMKTGWQKINMRWYYLLRSGAMHTGWLKEGKTWYYLNNSGAMAAGWVMVDNKWYYIDGSGAMMTGWKKVNGKWYYLLRSGAMHTGWLKEGAKWYYLSKNGEMLTGWYQDKGYWYYSNSSGVMQTGWILSGGKWYYLYSNGRMAANTTINGYKLGTDGAWINATIVNPRQNYTYEQMERDIAALKKQYPDLIQTQVIGKSVDGRNLYAVKLGKGSKEIFLNGAHHAREHMTTNLLMHMLDEYAQSYEGNSSYHGYKTREILNKTSIWFVPMVNPDGVSLVQKGYTSAKNPTYVLMMNNFSYNFSSWKANVRGVDLNRQYPADWARIKGDPGKPGPQNYKGPKALSEPEAKAVYDFTKAHDFKTAVAYHSSGEILYWYFDQTGSVYNSHHSLAKQVGNITGYSLVKPVNNPSGGGFTDWFVSETKKPGLTPEISPYTYGKPVPLGNYNKIWQQNRTVGLFLANEASSR